MLVMKEFMTLLTELSRLTGKTVTAENIWCYLSRYTDSTEFFVPFQKLLNGYRIAFPERKFRLSSPQMIDGGYWVVTATIMEGTEEIASSTRRCKEGIYEDEQVKGDAFNLVETTALRSVLKMQGWSAETLELTPRLKMYLSDLYDKDVNSVLNPVQPIVPKKPETKPNTPETQPEQSSEETVEEKPETSAPEDNTQDVETQLEQAMAETIPTGKFKGLTVSEFLKNLTSEDESTRKKAETLKELIFSSAGKKKFSAFAEAVQFCMSHQQ